MITLRRSFFNSSTLLIAVYLFLAGAAAVKVGIHEFRSSDIIDQIASREDLNSVTSMDVALNERKMNFFVQYMLKLVNPKKTTTAEARQNQQDVLSLIKDLKSEFLASADASLALLGLTVMFLFVAGGGEGGPAEINQRKIYALLSVSLIFFALGIICPVLTAVVKGEHALIGGFIIQTTSKGIISTVVTLFKSGDWIIGVLLTGFSICIPIFKGVATLVACNGRSSEQRRKTGRLLEAIGKWALTDVLVAAILLGCFSLNALHEDSGGIVAVPRFAFGFFVLYCVLAARTAYLLRRAVKTAPAARAGGQGPFGTAVMLGAALLAGAAFGYFVFDNFSYARELGNVAVVKLVRSHEELLASKIDVASSAPARVPFELPFTGTLNVEIKGGDNTPVGVAIYHDKGDARGADQKDALGSPLAGFAGPAAPALTRAARSPAGKYILTLYGDFKGDGLQTDKVSIHISVDP